MNRSTSHLGTTPGADISIHIGSLGKNLGFFYSITPGTLSGARKAIMVGCLTNTSWKAWPTNFGH